MALVELQGGEFDAVNLAEFGHFPVFMAPQGKSCIQALQDWQRKTVATFKTTEEMGWGKYIVQYIQY